MGPHVAVRVQRALSVPERASGMFLRLRVLHNLHHAVASLLPMLLYGVEHHPTHVFLHIHSIWRETARLKRLDLETSSFALVS